MSVIVLVVTWNGNDILNNVMGIFINSTSIIFLIMQVCRPKDESQELKELLDENSILLNKALLDKDKESYKLTILVESIKELHQGNTEFKMFLDELKNNNEDDDYDKIKEILGRQKTLIKRLVDVSSDIKHVFSDKWINKYNHRTKTLLEKKEITSNDIKISRATKDEIKHHLCDSEKVMTKFYDIIQVLDSFQMQGDKITNMIKEENIELKSFKSINLKEYNLPGQVCQSENDDEDHIA